MGALFLERHPHDEETLVWKDEYSDDWVRIDETGLVAAEWCRIPEPKEPE